MLAVFSFILKDSCSCRITALAHYVNYLHLSSTTFERLSCLVFLSLLRFRRVNTLKMTSPAEVSLMTKDSWTMKILLYFAIISGSELNGILFGCTRTEYLIPIHEFPSPTEKTPWN